MNWQPYGSIEVITGPMFSGKTAQLILRVTEAQAVGQRVLVIKPQSDTRYGQHEIRSLAGLRIDAVPVGQAAEIPDLVEPGTRVVAIDEGQFFDSGIVDVCSRLADTGLRIVVAGLDTDFRRDPFGPMPQLLAMAEVVHKLAALCSICGGQASFTQRLIDGQPASYSSPLVVVGSRELYTARCRLHYGTPETGASVDANPRQVASRFEGSPPTGHASRLPMTQCTPAGR